MSLRKLKQTLKINKEDIKENTTLLIKSNINSQIKSIVKLTKKRYWLMQKTIEKLTKRPFKKLSIGIMKLTKSSLDKDIEIIIINILELFLAYLFQHKKDFLIGYGKR